MDMLHYNYQATISQFTSANLEHNRVHATIDLWSSRSMEPILGVRFHCMDVNFCVKVKTVASRHFGDRHTACNIAAAFEEILMEYGIAPNNFGYQITDNASNMIKAFELFSVHASLTTSPMTELGMNSTSDSATATDGDEQQQQDDGEWSDLHAQEYNDLFSVSPEAAEDVNVAAGRPLLDCHALHALYNLLLRMLLRKFQLWRNC